MQNAQSRLSQCQRKLTTLDKLNTSHLKLQRIFTHTFPSWAIEVHATHLYSSTLLLSPDPSWLSKLTLDATSSQTNALKHLLNSRMPLSACSSTTSDPWCHVFGSNSVPTIIELPCCFVNQSIMWRLNPDESLCTMLKPNLLSQAS